MASLGLGVGKQFSGILTVSSKLLMSSSLSPFNLNLLKSIAKLRAACSCKLRCNFLLKGTQNLIISVLTSKWEKYFLWNHMPFMNRYFILFYHLHILKSSFFLYAVIMKYHIGTFGFNPWCRKRQNFPVIDKESSPFALSWSLLMSQLRSNFLVVDSLVTDVFNSFLHKIMDFLR